MNAPLPAQRDYLAVVSGLPRSGTSLMMQMIDGGGLPALVDGVRPPDEDNPKGYFEFEPVKRTKEDPSWIEQGIGKAVKMVHLLLADLPLSHRYRVVFMRRRLREVIESQNVMLARSGKPTDELPVDRLMRVFQRQMDEALAHMRRHRRCFRFIEVDYNEMIKDPRPQAERVSALLDGLDVERMVAAVDASLYRRRATKQPELSSPLPPSTRRQVGPC